MEKQFKEIKSGLDKSFDLMYFLQLTDFLTELVTKEMGYLKAFKVQEIEEVQNLKRDACELYTLMIKRLKGQPEYLNNLKVQERSILKEVTENLSILLESNQKTIKIFNEANQKVTELFQEVIQTRFNTNYVEKGKRYPPLDGLTGFGHR